MRCVAPIIRAARECNAGLLVFLADLIHYHSALFIFVRAIGLKKRKIEKSGGGGSVWIIRPRCQIRLVVVTSKRHFNLTPLHRKLNIHGSTSFIKLAWLPVSHACALHAHLAYKLISPKTNYSDTYKRRRLSWANNFSITMVRGAFSEDNKKPAKGEKNKHTQSSFGMRRPCVFAICRCSKNADSNFLKGPHCLGTTGQCACVCMCVFTALAPLLAFFITGQERAWAYLHSPCQSRFVFVNDL